MSVKDMKAERDAKLAQREAEKVVDSTKQGTDGSKEKSTTSDDLKELANHGVAR